MKQRNFREDDMLEIYGQSLQERGFKIFSLSGNQQGRFWYDIRGHRKAPDIVAVKKELILVGEGKLKSKDLFAENGKEYSDYQSIVYLLETQEACDQLLQKIEISCKKVGIPFLTDIHLKGIIVGGDPFDKLSALITDKRVGYAYVDVNNRKVYDTI